VVDNTGGLGMDISPWGPGAEPLCGSGAKTCRKKFSIYDRGHEPLSALVVPLTVFAADQLACDLRVDVIQCCCNVHVLARRS